MPFELKSPTAATLRTVTPRTEIHGDEKVCAISLGLSIVGPNTLLDALDGGRLRHALYMAVPDQEQLPGVEPSTPLLRARGIEEVKCAGTLEGWTVRFEHGIDDESAIVLGGSKVDKFRVIPTEGGSVELLFRVGTSDINEAEGGALFGMLGQEVMVSITAPVIAHGAPAIDGSVDAFKADHPEAGDLFAAGASDKHAGDFGQADDAPGTGSSDDAADSESGETESGDAEFEAGVQKALDDAGVAPRGRRPRKPAETIQ
jgi:hypothetical protein